jgi:rubrerythrin
MSDWYDTETLSNPDGSMDVHYCNGCGHMMADETVAEVDQCPACDYGNDEQAALRDSEGESRDGD